jgi:hypothetical protein
MRQEERTQRDVESLIRTIGPGPWPTTALLDAGWTHRRVRRAIEAGRLQRLARGVLWVGSGSAADGSQALTARVTAALLRAPRGAVVSHTTACQATALWLPRAVRMDQEPIHLTCPGTHGRSRAGLLVHGSPLTCDEVVHVGRVPLTSPARTAVDVARGRSLSDALICLDSAARRLSARTTWSGEFRDLARRGAATAQAREELAEVLSRQRGWPGVAVVREALALLDVGSESPLESWSRGEIVRAGLPQPAIGRAVQGASGRWYVVDFLWGEAGVIGEADGFGKYGTDPIEVADRLAAERERQRDLEAAGYVVLRWDWREPSAAWTARIAGALGLALPARTAR